MKKPSGLAPFLGALLLLSGFLSAAPTGAIVPHGSLEDAGWPLARLNDGSIEANQVSYSYTYPETTTPVRLYLIDTGIDSTEDASEWFAGNSNLTLLGTELVRGALDPTVSTAIKHGTQMLSIIAGPDAGAALGTPIEVMNYDIYPDGDGSASGVSLLIDALGKVQTHALTNPSMPSVVCIANGSSAANETSESLSNAIQALTSSGITVIVSAGNQGADAGSYIPAAYGTSDGVICVGASDIDNERRDDSNFGNSVDLFAPGEGVSSFDPLGQSAPGQSTSMNGTSPATALVTAAALANLSRDPSLSPAELEACLKENAFADSVNLVQLKPGDDADHDGVADDIEKFFGTNPDNPSERPAPPTLVRSGNTTTLGFSVDSDLFVAGTPGTLSDGSTWKVLRSQDLKNWTEASGVATPGVSVDGKTPISYAVTDNDVRAFYQIEVTPAVEP